MAVKHYVDDIPPSTGREYQIATSGGKSKITDVTAYEQVGSSFGAGDVNKACILECDYEKRGTVHALTTPNTVSENIKFYATRGMVKGDTFTLNGTPMTAVTTDGQSLGTNFFVANTIVECRRKENVLYFTSASNAILDDSTSKTYRIGVENGIMYIEED